MSLFRRSESRAISWSDMWGSGQVSATDPPSPLRLIPLYAAVTGIADDISVMPWHAYQSTGGWGARLPERPQLLVDPAGDGTGLIPWLNQGVMSAALWGYAFAVVLSSRAGTPVVARWVTPGTVNIDETGPMPVFTVNGTRVVDYIYVPGPVLPGSIKGLSPTSLFRLQFGKQLKAQRYASKLFDGGVMPPGVLKNSEKTLQDGAATAVKAKFKQSVADRDIFVTGKDWTWTPLSAPDDDVRFLETIKAGATEIAAIYRVQPEEIGGDSGSSLTYSTLEMSQLNRNRRALLPWVRRFEAVLSDVLPSGQYVKANMDALVRPDLEARMKAHEIGLRIGMETLAEGRALEDKPPLTDEEIQQWQNLYRKSGAPATEKTTTGGE